MNAPRELRFNVDYLKIGAEGPDTQAYNEYVGDMDEFAVYEGILTPEDINAHYIAGLSDSNATYTAAIQADNPLLWLRFEDASTSNGQIAKNSGSADISGVYTELGSGTFSQTTGIVSSTSALRFPDSESDYEVGLFVQVDNPDGEISSALNDGSGGVDVTIELWAKFVDVNSGGDENQYPRFFSHNGSYTARGGYGALVNNDPCQLGTIGGDTQDFINLAAPANDGDWHHYVFTYDSNYVPPPVGTYEYEVKDEDPVLYINFDEYPFVDDSNNDYWVDSADAVEFHEDAAGAMHGCAWLGGGWIAAAPQTTEPALPTDFSDAYAWSPNEDLTIEFWVATPQPSLVDTYAELFTDCNTLLLLVEGDFAPYRPYAARANDETRMATGDLDGEDSEFYIPGAWKTNIKWHHHVVIWDVNDNLAPGDPNNITPHWYLDGSDQKGNTYDMDDYGFRLTNGPEMDHFLFGGYGSRDNFSPGEGQPYGQYVDELAIYPKVLDPNRIDVHYNAWGPKDCNEVWARRMLPLSLGYQIITETKIQYKLDVDRDCNYDLYDFDRFAEDWFQCNNPPDIPGDPECEANWL